MDPTCALDGGEHGLWTEAGTQVPSVEVFWFCGKCGDVADDDPAGRQAQPVFVIEAGGEP